MHWNELPPPRITNETVEAYEARVGSAQRTKPVPPVLPIVTNDIRVIQYNEYQDWPMDFDVLDEEQDWIESFKSWPEVEAYIAKLKAEGYIHVIDRGDGWQHWYAKPKYM